MRVKLKAKEFPSCASTGKCVEHLSCHAADGGNWSAAAARTSYAYLDRSDMAGFCHPGDIAFVKGFFEQGSVTKKWQRRMRRIRINLWPSLRRWLACQCSDRYRLARQHYENV